MDTIKVNENNVYEILKSMVLLNFLISRIICSLIVNIRGTVIHV